MIFIMKIAGWYPNRLEVSNPGGLYGRLTLDGLGKTKADVRNPFLAAALEILDKTENRYSGIPTIYAEMKKLGLLEPKFENQRGTFKVTLYNQRKLQNDITEKIIEFCRKPRSKDVLAKEFGFDEKHPAYFINNYIVPLINEEKLKYTIPDKPKSKKSADCGGVKTPFLCFAHNSSSSSTMPNSAPSSSDFPVRMNSLNFSENSAKSEKPRGTSATAIFPFSFGMQILNSSIPHSTLHFFPKSEAIFFATARIPASSISIIFSFFAYSSEISFIGKRRRSRSEKNGRKIESISRTRQSSAEATFSGGGSGKKTR
ncbi:MAG: hypothetical protein IKO57_00365 [Treponema sp.]|nr:hypothetical protein [Treponema sp.]